MTGSSPSSLHCYKATGDHRNYFFISRLRTNHAMVTGGERDDMTSYNTAMEDRALGNLLLKAKPKRKSQVSPPEKPTRSRGRAVALEHGTNRHTGSVASKLRTSWSKSEKKPATGPSILFFQSVGGPQQCTSYIRKSDKFGPEQTRINGRDQQSRTSTYRWRKNA